VKVELLSHFGDDLMIVNAARVSYGKSKDEFGVKDANLLGFLVKHGHTSPFRHPQLQFRIKCPIFVERQLFKHVVGLTSNSISGRYVDFSDEYCIPEQLRLQSKDSKQGSGGDSEKDKNDYFIGKITNVIEQVKQLYKEMVDNGIAKEQCRVILPLCLETQFIWTGSLAAFIHLWKLRLKPDAQKETRDVVHEMLKQVINLPNAPFRFSLEACGFA